ncbi:MAG: LytTR family DNA-binding domain-containing protein [Bacteroidota bacterium]
MLSFLNKPYPFIAAGLSAKLYKAFTTGLFVILFLWLFDNKDQNSILLFVDNGVIVFISQLLFLFVLHRLFLKNLFRPGIKFWHYIVGITLASLLGFSLMYLYVTPVYFKTGYSFNSYNNYILENLPFLFPVTLFILGTDYVAVLRTHWKGEAGQSTDTAIATEPPIPVGEFVLYNETGIPVFNAGKSGIFYIRSADNYIEICYQSENGLRKELVRYQLSTVEADIEHNFLTRVHRSYLCNLDRVAGISGGIQNCRLHFKPGPGSVPVARSRARNIIQIVNSKKEQGK